MKNLQRLSILTVMSALVMLLVAMPISAGNPGASRADSIWLTDASGCTGDSITVDIMITNEDTEIDAFTMHVGFDNSMLEFDSGAEGALSPGGDGWLLFDANEATPGDITIAAFDISGVIATGSTGSIAQLTFNVTCAACTQGDTSVLEILSLADDIELFTATNGLFTYDCGVVPTETPTEPPVPTDTPVNTPEPTDTPVPPTNTPDPTDTPVNTPEPTDTPEPTNTMGPTDTPIVGDTIVLSDASGCNTDTITVDVLFNNDVTEIDAFTMHVGFDSTMLSYDSCVADVTPPGGWTMFDCNEATPGDITIGAFALDVIPTGSNGTLVQLTFTVDCPGCMEGDTSVLEVLSLADDLAAFASENGTFTYDCGGQPTPTPTDPGPTNTPAATNTPAPTDTPAPTNTQGPTSTPITGDTVALSNVSGCNGDQITVDVLFNNDVTDIDAFTMHVGYDTSMLSYVSCVAGTTPPGGWTMFDCNEAATGDVTIGAFALDIIPAGSNGVLAVLTFDVDCMGCNEGDMSALEVLSLADDLALFVSEDGTFTYDCGGQPTPTPTEPGPTNTPAATNTPSSTNTPAPGDWLLVEDATGVNGDDIVVQIMMNNADTAVDAFTMHLGYDTTMLAYQSCVAGALTPAGGWTMFDCNEASPGDVTIGGFALEEIPAGSSGYLVELTFTVDCAGCSQGDTSSLAITDLADDIDLFGTFDGTFTYGQGGAPTATPTEPGPTNTPAATNTPAPGDWLLVEDVNGENGDDVVVRIMMNNADTAVDAFTMHLGYDTTMLAYQSCMAGALTPAGGWVMFDCNEASPGDVTIGGFALEEIPAGSSGYLVELTFTVDCAGCSQGDTSSLSITDIADDIDLFDTYDGTFTYGQGGAPTATPTMAPTNTPTTPPTNTPTVPPTHTPTNTPTPTVPPTHTPTNTPTQTPTTAPPPTNTPTNTPTATPVCDVFGVDFSMPSDWFTPGMICAAEAVVCNPGPDEPTDVPLFVILDVYGELFWAPSFNQIFDGYMIDNLTVGEHQFQVIPEFTWPSGVGSASGIYWYAALTDAAITEIIGEWDMFEFGWGE